MNWTEHGRSNAQSGQKSDGFGSRMERMQRKAKKVGYSARSRRGVRVVRVPNEDAAAKRAYWLADIATALEQARQVVNELAVEGSPVDLELISRIEAAALEVQAMRLSRLSGAGQHIDPEWINDIPWKRSA